MRSIKKPRLFGSVASWSLLISSLLTNIYAGDSFDEGWWVVKIQWLEFDGLDSMKQRLYRLGEVRLISVHSLVRGEEAVKLGESAAAKARSGRGRRKDFKLTAEEFAKVVEHTERRELYSIWFELALPG